MRYLIAIDRGGTFTDAILWDRVTGEERVTKVLSGADSPLVAVRRLLDLPRGAPIPACDIRLGTTMATNALLERKGWPTGLLITRGFRDVLRIGTQARPRLFELDIRRPPPLHHVVEEVDARLSAQGEILLRPTRAAASAAFERLQSAGAKSLAIVVLHAHENPELELELEQWAAPYFDSIVLSHRASREEGLLGRASTTVLEAFLGPSLAQHLRELELELPGSQLLVMQSSGGLSTPAALRGPAALLSGPAGGVVAATRVAEARHLTRLVTLDMGGTSTDVSVVPLGQDLVLESEMAGVTVRSPMVDVRTVAAGGSSVCGFDGHALTVGPSSVGSRPGPLCFGRTEATQLSLTDVDLLLGRVVPDAFPIPLSVERARAGAEAVLARVRDRGHALTERELLLGFRRVAAAHMAEAIRQVTVDRGLDPKDVPLLVFGGAAGQHACAVARALGIRQILLHRHASVLSALGIGLAEETAIESTGAARRDLTDLVTGDALRSFSELERRVVERLGSDESIICQRVALLAYQGASTSLPIDFATPERMRAAFEAEHARQFGFVRSGTPIEAQALRVCGRRPRSMPERDGALVHDAPHAGLRRATRIVLDDGTEADVPLYGFPLPAQAPSVSGPALLIDPTSTVWIEPGFVARQDGDLLVIEVDAACQTAEARSTASVDPARVEVMASRFMSIAEQMGRTLARSAQSTNIRERLDFSCAIFDAGGRLIANAPHIPVHLGAMGESVRAAMRAFPNLRSGEVVLTNDPEAGGSHLPDITVVTPVFSTVDDATPAYFVACRGHHADVGGISPGSMPPHATTLEQEGVLLPPMLAVSEGRFLEAALRKAFTAGPWPARAVEQNLGDLRAQVAANHLGVELLLGLEREVGGHVVAAFMQHLLQVSAEKVRAAIEKLPAGVHRHALQTDAGTRLCVTIDVQPKRLDSHGRADLSHLTVDFTGTSPELETNFNAPRAVTRAAVLYFVRTLADDRLPLTDGCLDPVTLIVPRATILDPSPGRAVSAGNVETSMQVCDLLLAGVGRAAASQGTMNNLTFGDDSFGYYETIAGGAGAGPTWAGASGVHTHMTNTRITDPEVLESRFPVRVHRFELRTGSGGRGVYPGGDGVIRELEALRPLSASIVSDRRAHGAPGLHGGEAGLPGRNTLDGRDLGGNASFGWAAGAILRIETPGGGGYGALGNDPAGAADTGAAGAGCDSPAAGAKS